MDYLNIFYENEFQYREINEKKIQQFLILFLGQTNLPFLAYYGEIQDWNYDLLYSLKKYVYTFYPQYISLFHSLLNDFNFCNRYHIIDVVDDLGCETNKEIPKNVIELAQISPYVKNIEYLDHKIYLETIANEYSFYSLRDYYRHQFTALNYIRTCRFSLAGDCHNQSWNFIHILDEPADLITELRPYIFDGNIYHSLIRDENEMYVDLAHQIVYDKTMKDELFAGKIVSETNKDDLENNVEEAILAIDNDTAEEFSEPLLLALHKQYKQSR